MNLQNSYGSAQSVLPADTVEFLATQVQIQVQVFIDTLVA